MGLCIAGYTHQHCRGGVRSRHLRPQQPFTISKPLIPIPTARLQSSPCWFPVPTTIFLTTTVQQDDYYRQPDNAPLCNPQQSTLRLSRVEQENFLVDYSLHFLDQTLKPENNQTNPGENKTTWQPLISPDKVSPFTALTNIAIPQAQRQLVFNPSSAVSNNLPAPCLRERRRNGMSRFPTLQRGDAPSSPIS